MDELGLNLLLLACSKQVVAAAWHRRCCPRMWTGVVSAEDSGSHLSPLVGFLISCDIVSGASTCAHRRTFTASTCVVTLTVARLHYGFASISTGVWFCTHSIIKRSSSLHSI
uniref:Secreted protein n=1 Tax=Rhipicephalus zambeziensis TaxID=60191 RepID=A0A224YC58_9ACAR